MGSPTFSSAATSADGTKVILTYNEALSANKAAASTFSVRSGGVTNAVTGVAVNGATVELTLTNPIQRGQAVHASYVDPTAGNDANAVQDAGGTDSATLKTANVNNQSTIAPSSALAFGIQQIGSDLDGRKINARAGESVSLSEDGKIIAIGSLNDNTIDSGRGSVRVYEQVGNSWRQLGLDINGEARGDKFGNEVSLSSDGSRLAVGAVRNNPGGGNTKKDGGHARVYQFDGNNWIQLGPDIDGEKINDRSGSAVQISGDGSTVVVGAYRHNNNRGHAKVYRYNAVSNSWNTLGQEIQGGQVKEYAGTSVDISDDGTVVAVAGNGYDPANNKKDRGRVRVYKYNGNQWILRGNGIVGEGNADNSGRSISLSADGNTIAIGANANDVPKKKNCGHVRVYGFNGITDQWEKVGNDINGDKRGDNFGYSVSLSSDATRLAAAAPRYEPNGKNLTGQAKIYELRNNSWVELGKISGENSDDKAGETEQGGTGISMSGDGRRFTLGARFNDGNGDRSGHARVYDINNNGPSLTAQTQSVAEDASAGEILNLNDSNTGTDNDPDGDSIAYSITAGNDAGIFSIHSASGAISIAAGKSLDYETTTSHALTIQATDGAVTTTGTTTVNVTNINDNAPAIANANPSVTESAAPGSSIHNVNDSHTNTDNDRDGNAISYSITGGNEAGLFAINTGSGLISVAAGKALDFETTTTHTLTTQATDGSNIDNATVTVSVTNVNDNAPAIANATTSVDEDEPAGTNIININDGNTGNDTDADGDAITYSITNGNPAGLFAINGASGLISIATGKTLDYSTASSHALTIGATDGTNTDTATIQVSVGNTDVNAPSIEDATPSVAENATPGSSIIDINDSNTGNDTDNDGDTIAYSITGGNTNGLFAIHQASGVISLAAGKALDFETTASHSLSVQASDGSKTDNATINVSVTNINDNAPVVANANTSVAENAAAGATIHNFSDSHTGNDTDRDGNALGYSITAGNDAGLFSVNAGSGVISIAAGQSLDFETATSHTLTVQASDGSNTDTSSLAVSVNNVNDNAPAIANANASVAENAAAGATIHNFSDSHTGNDTDRDGNALGYSITAGNDAGLFSVNAGSGVISIAAGQSLDFETATSHTLTVQASDGSNTDNASLAVSVTNINDNAPSPADGNVQVLETINPGTELYDTQDSNTNQDVDLDGNDITYSITDGNGEGLFTADASTGKITLSTGKSLDFDRKDQHILQIRGNDGVNQGTANVTIDVIDSNTAPVANDDSATLNENSTLSKAANTGVIRTNDTDAQGDILEVIAFQTGRIDNASPVIGTAGVTLDGEYGQLTLRQDGSYDYAANRTAADALTTGETATDTFSYTITDDKLSDNAEIDFTINGVNDAPILVDAIKTKKYTEGQGNVTVIDGSLSIRDVDDTNIESASVAITGEYESTEDRLGFQNNFGITGQWTQGTGVLALSGSTTKANYESALQTVTYTNTNNANPVLGLRTITWQINDGALNSTGVTSGVDVGGVNDSPEAVNETFALNAGGSVSTPGQNSFLTNDTDPENNALSIHSFRLGSENDSNPDFAAGGTINGLYGQLTVQANGNYIYNANQAAAHRLLQGETRTETFNYTIRDTSNAEDLGEASFTITGINDKPTATDDSKTVNENDNKFFANAEGLLINDTDIDGDPLEVTEIRTGIKTANPAATNTAGDQVAGSFGKLVLESDGSYRYNANHGNVDALDAGDIEEDIFTYTLSDSKLVDKAEIRIRVSGINDAPILSAIAAGSIAEQASNNGFTSNGLNGQLIATDADASASLSYGISGTNTTLRNQNQNRNFLSNIDRSSQLPRSISNRENNENILLGNVSTTSLSGTYGQLTINPNTGAYAYTPNPARINALNSNQTATESFELFVSDGSLLSRQTFNIEITGSNNTNPAGASNPPSSGTDRDAGKATRGLTITVNGNKNRAGNLVTSETGSSTTFSVVLNAQPSDNVTVFISGLDPTEGVLSASSLTFTKANWDTPQTVTVTGLDDKARDGDITYQLTATANQTGGYVGNEVARIKISNIDNETIPIVPQPPSDPTTRALSLNSKGNGFKVTGRDGLWVQLEALQSNAAMQNSLEIVNSFGYAIGSIGATSHSTNLGKKEVFLEAGNEIIFHQISQNIHRNLLPRLQIQANSDHFTLHLDDTADGDNDYDDLIIKVTASPNPLNPTAIHLASEQKEIQGSILNLSQFNGQAARLRLTLHSDCANTSHVAFVKLTGNELEGFSVNGIASSAGELFEQTVRDNLINPLGTELSISGQSIKQVEWTLDQKDAGFYAPVFINKETNHLFTYGATSAQDKNIHIKNLGSNFFGYEDTISSQGSDWDFNDITMLVEMI